MTEVPNVHLADGTTIPQVGFGTWQVPDAEAEASVASALEVGYRHIDTAAAYGNEAGVGRALARSGILRNELYVTTKLWNSDHKRGDARRAIERSLTKLGLDQLDLYLIHWPATRRYGDAYIEAWTAMQEFKAEGLTRSIGVSNFNVEHLDKLSGETPVLNQLECHPTFARHDIRGDLNTRGIVLESWSPLGSGADLDNPVLAGIAQDLGRSVAQVILRWHVQQGFVVLPKSVTPARIAENLSIFDFELNEDQLALIATIDAGNRVGGDPVTVAF